MEVVNFASTQSLKGLGSFIYLFILGINISSTSDAIRLILAKIFSLQIYFFFLCAVQRNTIVLIQ